MITPKTYGNALAYLKTSSSNQSSAYMTGLQSLSGSNIGARKANAGYSSFDLAAQSRMSAISGSIFVAIWGLSRAAFPLNSNWSWRSIPT